MVVTRLGPVFGFEAVFEVDHRRGPGFGELGDPAVVDLADRHRVQVMDLLPTVAPRRDEVGLLEHLQVLHHAEARQLGQFVAELSEREAVVAEQTVEQATTTRVGQRLEDRVVVHAGHYT